MRDYLSTQDPTEKQVRIKRVRRSVRDLDGGAQGRKTLLRLEPTTNITSDMNKGKCLVYDFEAQTEKPACDIKFMASSIKDGAVNNREAYGVKRAGLGRTMVDGGSNPTVFRAGQGFASSSGVRSTIMKHRRRPSKWKRQAHKTKRNSRVVYKEKSMENGEEEGTTKKKASEEVK
ncbi:hypothetical protein V5N11_012465 [Cardamine amara subsp. amara]|uniref:Uncharacterized protein n=1 Tax=Cardamine amara subsp. amara TaxID=228776 RepID=A0ABD0ZHM6_CARAN